jgi:hypothetical protein
MIQSTLLAALEAAFQAAVKSEVESQLSELAAKVAALETRLADATPQRFDAEAVAESLSDEQLRYIARRLSPSDIAASVDWSEELDYSQIVGAIDYSEIVGELDYSELAGELNYSALVEHVNLDEPLRAVLAGRFVTIQL